jgi:hypothetical protein
MHRSPQAFRPTAQVSVEVFESLDLSEFLEPIVGAPGMVKFRRFPPRSLASSRALQVICRGFVDGGRFSMYGSPPSESDMERADQGE